jgi:dynein heavy chain
VDAITQATLQLYYTCLEKLPRTPLKFHYIFNLRDLSRVYEGLYLATVDKFKTKASFIRLWRNECHRVFGDRLINGTDVGLVQDEIIPGLIRQHFKDTEEEALQMPLFFGDFALSEPGDESEDPRLYENLSGDKVKEKLDFFLSEYNDENKAMDLVLFIDALEHLTRIHRVIRFPKGSALLVGYGGSGKQSLTRLATYVSGMSIFRLNLTRTYGTDDLKEDLRQLYKVVVKQPKVFMFTDADVADEGFLELINNILTIGMVPSLFPEEEKDGLCSPLDAEIRRKKLPETKDFRWGYFVNRARENIHICLCMSPAGDSLRIRCRSFPGLVSNTSIDWFFPWPEDALNAVASHFLQNVTLEDEMLPKVTDHIVMIHLSVQKYSADFEQVYKRKNYSTPKNYLDFISNYMKFLTDKRKNIDSSVTRLEGGLATLAKATDDTAVLQEELAVQDADIAEKKAVVEEMIKNIQEKSAIAGKQEKEAQEKKAFLEVQNKEIAEKKAEADEQLAIAEPIIAKAQEALNDIK